MHILTICTYLKSVLFLFFSPQVVSTNIPKQVNVCCAHAQKLEFARVKKLQLEQETMDGHYRLPIGSCCNRVRKFRVISYCYIYNNILLRL
jgi:hypothetical protein